MFTTKDPGEEQQRVIDASVGQPFRFEQGASLHVGILGMVGRPSGPHDEAPFVTGESHSGRSRCELDLSQLQEPDQEAPPLHVWFDPERTILDISAAFADVPAEALTGSGIPPAVVGGPVSAERDGDSGDGVMAMLTQMCAGKMVLDPDAMLRLIASEHLRDFAEHDVDDDRPVRAFNAQLSINHFLDEVGLTPTALINQIAILGYDIRRDFGRDAVVALDGYFNMAQVELAWFVEESGQIHAAQAILTLTDFFAAWFSTERAITQIAAEENTPIDEVRTFVEQAIEAKRLVYVHAIWQTFEFDDTVEPLAWPEAEDLSADIGGQANRLRTAAENSREHTAAAEAAAAEAAAEATGALAGADNVMVDPGMIEHMRASSGSMYFALSEVDGDAVAALQQAQTAVQAVRHPDEPAEALASFMSEIVETDDGAHFWADISDMEEETEVLQEVLNAVVQAVASTVSSAHLSADGR